MIKIRNGVLLKGCLRLILSLFIFTNVSELVAMQRVSRLPVSFPSKNIIMFHGTEGAGQKIIVPLNIAKKSKIIASMMYDLGGEKAIIKSKISIPLDFPREVIQKAFDILTISSSLQQKRLKEYSLRDLVYLMNFFNQYDFPNDVKELVNNVIINYQIRNDEDQKTIEFLSRDIAQVAFINPAINVLKDVVIKKYINDVDRQTVLLSDNYSGEYPEFTLGDHNIYSIAFRPDGKKMVSGGKIVSDTTQNLLLWSVKNDGSIDQTPQLFPKNIKLPAEINSVAFSPDGKKIVSASLSTDENLNNLLLWTFVDGTINETPRVLKGHPEGVSTVAFHPKGKIMVSGGLDGTEEEILLLWKFNEDGTINLIPQILKGYSEGIRSLVFSSDGKTMVSHGYGEKSILIWTFDDDVTINPIPKVLEHGYMPDEIDTIALSPDGKKLMVAIKNDILLWHLDDINMTKQTFKSLPEGYYCQSLAFSHDNKKFIIRCAKGKANQIFLCDINDPERCQLIHGTSVRGIPVVFSPDDTKIVAGFKGEFIAWNLFKPEEIKLFNELSRKLTAAQAQLISRLSELLLDEKEIALSSFDKRIYDGLPIEVQKILKYIPLIITFDPGELEKSKLKIRSFLQSGKSTGYNETINLLRTVAKPGTLDRQALEMVVKEMGLE